MFNIVSGKLFEIETIKTEVIQMLHTSIPISKSGAVCLYEEANLRYYQIDSKVVVPKS